MAQITNDCRWHRRKRIQVSWGGSEVSRGHDTRAVVWRNQEKFLVKRKTQISRKCMLWSHWREAGREERKNREKGGTIQGSNNCRIDVFVRARGADVIDIGYFRVLWGGHVWSWVTGDHQCFLHIALEMFTASLYYCCNLKINYMLRKKCFYSIVWYFLSFLSLQLVFLLQYDNTIFLNPSIFLNILL